MPTTYRALDIEALQSLFTTTPIESKTTNFYHGNNGNDDLRGTIRPDEIVGYRGNDNLAGLRGFDTIMGGQGNDTVRGGNGRDVLKGGQGADIIYGGFGLNTSGSEKDESADKIYFKSDQLAWN